MAAPKAGYGKDPFNCKHLFWEVYMLYLYACYICMHACMLYTQTYIRSVHIRIHHVQSCRQHAKCAAHPERKCCRIPRATYACKVPVMHVHEAQQHTKANGIYINNSCCQNGSKQASNQRALWIFRAQWYCSRSITAEPASFQHLVATLFFRPMKSSSLNV